jgi:hypothetical protein
MNGITISLLTVLALPPQGQPTPKYPVSKDTTYVTGPIDKDGFIDYAAALNQLLGKSITPETNANALMMI